ncbi:MAG: helix-turn-helix domain-containing protein [Piscirickettsiaceae bacterium]|nr:helix-turn-helix domain-containing protein [Piscirickettsiaceae bacterium]
MTETENDDNVVADTVLTVGQQLKQAREAKKITISEVAAQLRLTKDSIIYLEKNQWDKLHGRAYARGYLSSYVNFLALPKDELLAAFNIEYKTEEPLHIHSPQVTVQNKSRLLPFILIGIVFIVIWFSYQQWQTPSEVNSELKIEVTSEQEAVDAFSSSVVEPLLDTDNEQLTVENNENVTDIEPLVGDKLTNLDEQILEPQDQLEIPSETVIDEVVATSVVIELQFTEDSWAEVIDADGQVLVNKVMTAGKKLVLAGQPPLAVLLGHAAGVTVKYNDEKIDTTAYVKGDVARFSLGVEL